MPITVQWANDEKTVLLESFADAWDLDDYTQMIDQAAELLASVPHIVDIVVDASRSRVPTTSLIPAIRYGIQKLPPNQGVTVWVKLHTFFKTLIYTAQKFSPRLAHSMFFVETLDDAFRVIADQRRARNRV